MNRLNRTFGIVWAAGFLISSLPVLSHAYLDAGSGSMMVQLLLAGTAGLAVFIRLVWQQISTNLKSLLQKIKAD